MTRDEMTIAAATHAWQVMAPPARCTSGLRGRGTDRLGVFRRAVFRLCPCREPSGEESSMNDSKCKHDPCRCTGDEIQSDGHCSDSCRNERMENGRCACGHADCQ
jgi:hypothetical protein